MATMKRDGAQISLWQSTANGYNTGSIGNSSNVYDVIIAGGGITGLTCALLLQQQGRKCLLAEAYNIGFGTTGGTTAHLNTVLDTPYYTIASNFSDTVAKQVAQGAKLSLELVSALCRRYDINAGFAEKKAYLYAQTPEEEQELEKILQSAVTAGISGRWTDDIIVPDAFIKAVVFDAQAQMHPLRYITGLARAFELSGGVILEDCQVQQVKHGEPVEVHTSLGKLRAHDFIYATHMPPGINIFNFRCAPYRSYAAAFTLRDAKEYPDGLAYDLKDPYHYFRTQEIDGLRYLIAGGYDHKTGHNDNTNYAFTQLEAFVNKLYKGAKLSHKWSSQYYEPVDGLPYIGLMPEHKHVYVATGFGGNGMTYGTLAGHVLTQLICSGQSEYKDVFDPARIKPIAGFQKFISENADVVSHLITDRFRKEDIKQLAQLAHGDGAVVDYQDKALALYKDERGEVYAHSAVCRHAGCIVKWNNAEKTWDCCCHGARYAYDGSLVTGPATEGLRKVNIT